MQNLEIKNKVIGTFSGRLIEAVSKKTGNSYAKIQLNDVNYSFMITAEECEALKILSTQGLDIGDLNIHYVERPRKDTGELFYSLTLVELEKWDIVNSRSKRIILDYSIGIATKLISVEDRAIVENLSQDNAVVDTKETKNSKKE